MKLYALIFFAAIFFFSVQDGRTDVRVGDLEVSLSRLEDRVIQHKKGVEGSIAWQKEGIAELDEDRVARLEAWLVKTKNE